MLTRLLTNLKGIYTKIGDDRRALGVVERLLMISADVTDRESGTGVSCWPASDVTRTRLVSSRRTSGSLRSADDRGQSRTSSASFGPAGTTATEGWNDRPLHVPARSFRACSTRVASRPSITVRTLVRHFGDPSPSIGAATGVDAVFDRSHRARLVFLADLPVRC